MFTGRARRFKLMHGRSGTILPAQQWGCTHPTNFLGGCKGQFIGADNGVEESPEGDVSQIERTAYSVAKVLSGAFSDSYI